jgi:Domain of unknown function (DUF4352)
MNKKVVGAVIVLLLVLTVAGAGCTSSPTTTSPSPQAQTTQTGQASGSSTDLMLTVASKGEATTIPPISKADAGNKYVLYNAALKNKDVKGLDTNPFWFDLRVSNGSSYGIDLYATVSVKGYFPVTNGTQPGDTVNGTVVFQIPQTAKPVAIDYDDIMHNVTANL